MDQHNRAVAAVAASVRHFYKRKEPFRIHHGSTNSTRPHSLKRSNVVDTAGLNHVLSIDVVGRTVIVEPNVPMDQLVAATLKHGLVPPVVMEFPGITVGGGFSGASGESSSFRHGFFDRTVNWIEMVLANGEVVKASSTENPELFEGAAGSFGTFGVTTLLEIRLLVAKKNVEVTYWPIGSIEQALSKLEMVQKDTSVHYVDGILYSLDSGVIITGRLTDELSKKVTKTQRFTRAHDPWFYLHARKTIAKSSNPVTELTPLVDYLFRYDRGAFWTGSWAFKYFLVPFNRISRWGLDYFMHTRVMYHALHESGHAKQFIIQDIALPHSSIKQFVEYIDKTLDIYPLWLCPLRPGDAGTSFHPFSPRKEPLLNIGVWGPGPKRTEEFVEVNRNLEKRVTELGGRKWLYAHAYYDEPEFWTIYKKDWYDLLRAKYDATSLPNVFQKVTTSAEVKTKESLLWNIWPVSGLYGVWKSLVGHDYLLARNRSSFQSLLVLLAVLLGLMALLMPFVSSERSVDTPAFRAA